MGLPARDVRFLAGIAFIFITLSLFVVFSPYLSLEYLESQRSFLTQVYSRHPVLAPVLYISASAVLIGLALPITGVLALLGGALFGFSIGWIISSVAGTIGALIVFLWSRYLFRDGLRKRFQRQFSAVEKGIEAEGAYYLFGIRLIAVFPFFLVNLLCGLTNIRLHQYVIVTFIGQTIVVAFWVLAGAKIASLTSVGDVMNLESVAVLCLAGLLPFLTHRLFSRLRARNRQGRAIE